MMNYFISPKLTWLIIRILMASMFIESFIDKLIHWNTYLDETIGKGIPFPALGLGMAAVVEVLGSASLLTNKYIRLASAMLAGYVFVLGFFYFNFWNMTGMEAAMARKEFLKDFAVIAGLLMIALNVDRSNISPR